MLTPLSILSLDQGPPWREPDDTRGLEEAKTPEVAPGRYLVVLPALGAWLAVSVPRRVPSRSRG
jgi:hypothetical protein